MKKKLLTILLSVFMMIGTFTARVFADGNVAKIDNTEYATLAAAIAAVPTDGNEVTIVMIGDETIIGNAGVTIAANQSVVLDLNGHTIKNAVNKNEGSQVITNNGTLTIKDSTDINNDGSGAGLILNAVEEGTQAGEWWSTPQYNYATNVITNKGTLIIESGELYETAAGSICYAIDNNSSASDAIAIVKGGYIHKDSGTAVRMFCNSTTKNNKLDVSGGNISAGYAGVWIQLPGNSAEKKKCELNVTGGTLKGEYAFYDYSYGDLFDEVKYNISGGVFDGEIFSYGANIDISGGMFKKDIFAYDGDNIATGIINYNEEHNPVFAINTFVEENITYNCYWTYEIAAPYIPVDNLNEETKNEYPYTIGAIYEAKIGDTKYFTLKDAITNAKEGDTIEVLENIVLQESINVNKNNITIDGQSHTITADPNFEGFDIYEVGGDKQKYGSTDLLTVSGDNVTIQNLTVDVSQYRGMSCITTKGGNNVTYKNLTYKGRGSGHYYGYGNGTITFDNCDIQTTGYGIHFSAEKDTYQLEIIDSKVHGWNSFGGASELVAINTEFYGANDADNGVKKNGLLAKFRPYTHAELINCKFSVDYLDNNSDFTGFDTGSETDVAFFNCSIINNDGTANNEHDVYEIIDYRDVEKTNKSLFMFVPSEKFDDDYEKLIVVTRQTDLIIPGYKTIKLPNVKDFDEKNNVYTFVIRKASDGNKVVITQTDDNVPEYYEKVTELQDAIDNVTYANQQKFDNNQTVNKTTITVTNGDNRIEAEIDDKVIIVADTNNGNVVKADPGYKLNNPQTSGGKTTYTATALDIGQYVTDVGTVEDAPEATRGTKASQKIETKTNEEVLQGITPAVQQSADKVDDTVNNKQLGTIVNDNLNTLLANRGINQGTAAKALNNAGIITNNKTVVITNKQTADDENKHYVEGNQVSVFVRTYYDTEVKEDKTSETNKSYSLDITPMYQAYASTVNNINAMVTEGDPTVSETNPVNAVKIGESLPVDCTGKTINLKIQLPTGFITNTSQKVYVIHTLADANGTKKIYDTTVTENAGEFYIEFTNPDGFSVFEITLKKPTPTPSSDPKPRYRIPNTGVEGMPTNNYSLLKLSSLSLLAIGTYMVIKKKKDN